MYYLLMKVRDEKEMKFIYFFFFIGKNTDKMVKYKGCYIKKVSKIRMLKHKNVLVFLGQTLLYFAIFMALIYLYNYLGQGQGNFIYNEF